MVHRTFICQVLIGRILLDSFPGYTGERAFFKFDTGKIVTVYYWWMVGFEPTTPNPMVLPTTPFVRELYGISLFDHLLAKG